MNMLWASVTLPLPKNQQLAIEIEWLEKIGLFSEVFSVSFRDPWSPPQYGCFQK